MARGDLLLGQTLGAFRIDASIGSGATGVVYRAEPEDGGPMVALKVLHDDIGSITGLERRFRREARVLDKLTHPNVVRILDFGRARDRTFIAMELLEGETLEDALSVAPMDPARVLEIYEPILEALAEAHAHEVVHRDLKPANVFLQTDGEVKLLDFGLAKMLSIDEVAAEDGTLTRKGRIVGTPAYMAPEQITGVFIDVRADVYALGVMLYELLADRRPFLYERRWQLLRAHLLEPVPPIREAREGLRICDELVALIERALHKDAAERFENAAGMLEAVRALPDDPVAVDLSARRSSSRQRSGATSAVIDPAVTKQVTESARPPAVSLGPPSDADAPAIRERDRPTLPLPPPPAQRSAPAIPTAALFVIALALMGAAAALFASILAG